MNLFQLHEWQDLMLFLVIYDGKLNNFIVLDKLFKDDTFSCGETRTFPPFFCYFIDKVMVKQSS